MIYLLITSFIWAFSFGLIGNRLADLDFAGVTLIRMTLAFLSFLPFIDRGRPSILLAVKLLLLGAVQFGLMYILYIASFKYLPSHAVALFTVTTPIHVAMLASLRDLRHAFRPILAAVIAVAGTAAVYWRVPAADRLWTGFALVQGSNFCFALGQWLYRRVMQGVEDISNHQAMTWMYAGGVMLSMPFAIEGVRQHGFQPDRSQILVLLYLGIVASGICFWLWNIGARRVGNPGTLAVMNNAKIPLGMAVSLLCFGESADLWRLLLAGVAMLVAVAICEWPSRRTASPAPAGG